MGCCSKDEVEEMQHWPECVLPRWPLLTSQPQELRYQPRRHGTGLARCRPVPALISLVLLRAEGWELGGAFSAGDFEFNKHGESVGTSIRMSSLRSQTHC